MPYMATLMLIKMRELHDQDLEMQICCGAFVQGQEAQSMASRNCRRQAEDCTTSERRGVVAARASASCVVVWGCVREVFF